MMPFVTVKITKRYCDCLFLSLYIYTARLNLYFMNFIFKKKKEKRPPSIYERKEEPPLESYFRNMLFSWRNDNLIS